MFRAICAGASSIEQMIKQGVTAAVQLISYQQDTSDTPVLGLLGADFYLKTSFGKLKASCRQVF